jgi:hypothetical protein
MEAAMNRFLSVLALAAALCCHGAAYDDTPVKSGPQAGQELPGPFHVYNVNGPHAGNQHCLVCEYGLRPVVLIFSREIPNPEKPAKNLMQKVDQTLGKLDGRLKGFVVFLNDEQLESRKDFIKKLDGWDTASDIKNLVLAVDGASGPDKYNLNKDASVTVLLYQELKVVNNFAYAADKMTDKDVDAILAAIDKPAKK